MHDSIKGIQWPIDVGVRLDNLVQVQCHKDSLTVDHRKRHKVVLWVPRYWPAMGGTELHTHELALRLSATLDIQVLTHCDPTATLDSSRQVDTSTLTRSISADGQTRIHLTGFKFPMSLAMRLLAKLRDRNRIFRPLFRLLFVAGVFRQVNRVCKDADLVHFVYNGLSDAVPLAAGTAAKRGIPFVFTPNVCDTSGSPTAWNSKAFIRLYKSATRLIALTPHEADWLVAHGADPARISIVPYGPIFSGTADGARFRQKIGISKNQKIVLFLGRVVPIKGYDLLLEARHTIWKNHPETRIVYMGPVVEEAVEEIQAVDDARIVLIDNISQEEKCDALAACDLMCVPSRSESLGVVFIEAAFCGKPVVALDIPVLHDVISHEQDGYLVKHEAAAVASSVVRLLDNPNLAAQLGEHAKEKAERLYAWEKVTEGISQAYHTAMLEPQPNSVTPLSVVKANYS